MFNDNLKKYRGLKGLTQEQLAAKINNILIDRDYKKSNVQSWERDVSPKLEVITAIADILNIPEQFLFDDSKETINKIISKEAPSLKMIVEHTLKIPLLDGYVGAGSTGMIDRFAVNDYVYIDNLSIKPKYANQTIIALTVKGDSMKPYVDDDDMVLFHPIEDGQYHLSDGKYIIRTINGIMVKNLSFRSNGDIVISSCNKGYSDEIIKSFESQECLDILGIVVGRILKS